MDTVNYYSRFDSIYWQSFTVIIHALRLTNNINRGIDVWRTAWISGLWNVKTSSLTLHDVTVPKSCRTTSISLINPVNTYAEDERTVAKQGHLFILYQFSLLLDIVPNHNSYLTGLALLSDITTVGKIVKSFCCLPEVWI